MALIDFLTSYDLFSNKFDTIQNSMLFFLVYYMKKGKSLTLTDFKNHGKDEKYKKRKLHLTCEECE